MSNQKFIPGGHQVPLEMFTSMDIVSPLRARQLGVEDLEAAVEKLAAHGFEFDKESGRFGATFIQVGYRLTPESRDRAKEALKETST